jgi:hypothetical protein
MPVIRYAPMSRGWGKGRRVADADQTGSGIHDNPY